MQILRCTKCGLPKSTDEFYKMPPSQRCPPAWLGRRMPCKACVRAYQNAWGSKPAKVAARKQRQRMYTRTERARSLARKRWRRRWADADFRRSEKLRKKQYHARPAVAAAIKRRHADWLQDPDNVLKLKQLQAAYAKSPIGKLKASLRAAFRRSLYRAAGDIDTDLVSSVACRYGECAYCGKAADTIDHIIPLCRGGSNAFDNLVPACRRCNTKKGAKSIVQFLGSTEAMQFYARHSAILEEAVHERESSPPEA